MKNITEWFDRLFYLFAKNTLSSKEEKRKVYSCDCEDMYEYMENIIQPDSYIQ